MRLDISVSRWPANRPFRGGDFRINSGEIVLRPFRRDAFSPRVPRRVEEINNDYSSGEGSDTSSPMK